MAARQTRTHASSRQLASVGLFVQLPLLVAGWLIWTAARGTTHWFDDLFIFRNAGNAILHGRSPYVTPTAALFVHSDKFVYPTPFALPFVPLALMPAAAARITFLICSFLALGLALRLLGVRDIRCYGLALLTPPVLGAFGVGSFGPFLVLALALGWRYRDHAAAGVVLALAAAAKLFLWPVLVWLLVTRRIRATAASVGTVAALGLLWLAVDAHGLREYPATLHALNDVQRWRSYSPQSLLLSFGLGTAATAAAGVALAVFGVAAIFFLARRPDGDQRAFVASIGVALLATPILWEHYLVLLLVPIALVAPRLSAPWLALLAFWISPFPKALGSSWKIAVVLVLTSLILAGTLGLRGRIRFGARRRDGVAGRPIASQPF